MFAGLAEMLGLYVATAWTAVTPGRAARVLTLPAATLTWMPLYASWSCPTIRPPALLMRGTMASWCFLMPARADVRSLVVNARPELVCWTTTGSPAIWSMIVILRLGSRSRGRRPLSTRDAMSIRWDG